MDFEVRFLRLKIKRIHENPTESVVYESDFKSTPLWLSSFVCNSFPSLHFWKYESKSVSTQICIEEEYNLILPLQEIYPLVLTIKLRESE